MSKTSWTPNWSLCYCWFTHTHTRPTWDQIETSGSAHVLIAADNHSRPLFSGKSAKVEMGSIKPNGDISQQAAHLAIPISIHEGKAHHGA